MSLPETPKIKKISVLKRVPFVFKNTNDGIAVVLSRILPLSMSNPLQIQIWWGLGQAPADGDEFELHLVAMNAVNGPDIGGVRQRAVWSAIQHWRHVGTAANAVQTIIPENVPLFGGGQGNLDLATRKNDFTWVLFTLNSNARELRGIGSVTLQDTLLQRKWKSDNYTWDSDPDLPNSRGETGIDLGWY